MENLQNILRISLYCGENCGTIAELDVRWSGRLRPRGGNFRGVCPITGRQQILVTGRCALCGRALQAELVLPRTADVFCFPSLREGLAVSVIEAMKCGLPVVCSRIRGNTDLISQNGGILFDPHYADDCRHAIMQILCSDLRYKGNINLENSSNYSTERIVSQLKSIYESWMSRNVHA